MNCTQAQDRFAELLDRRLEATASGSGGQVTTRSISTPSAE